MNNNITTSGNNPFNPSLKMSSVEIAELMEKNHQHVMRDIRDMIEEEAISLSNFGQSNYLNSRNQEQPMYLLDFDATMLLITGYDSKRRMMVIKRWRQLETGEALPGAQGLDLSMEALVARIVALVVPEVAKQVLPLAGKFENQLERTRSDFSYYSSVSGFYHYFCQDGGQNVVVLKDKLYDVYRQFCEIGGGTPFTKSFFCGQLYRAVTGCSASTVTVDGKRIPAIRGLSLLPGWPTIMIDLKTSSADRAAKELADRRQLYFGIGADDSEA